MHIPSLIEKKRDGHELSSEEIESLISDFTSGEIPEYQMSAWAMAVLFRGMNPAETQHLTEAMMNTGRVLKYPKNSPPKIDKHSTGGIGDKVSLVLAPLLACDEAWVPMIAGRGLGITGGTLDKLDSGAFMKTRKDAEQLAAAMTSVGESMGVKMSHLLSSMDEPLGRAVGNALEIAECVEILQGGGPPDLVKLIVDLAKKVSTTQ